MNNLSLFDSVHTVESIPLPDATLSFIPSFYRPPQSERYKDALLKEISWQQEKIFLWGKEHLQPRLSAWYGDERSTYSYSGKTFDPLPWTPTLQAIKAHVEKALGCHFNSVLANFYRDEQDGVGWHSDDERELGNTPLIASLSLGETRIFKMRHKNKKYLKPLSLALTDGSLLVMSGETQKFWRHAVNKESKAKGPRINLTFRQIFY